MKVIRKSEIYTKKEEDQVLTEKDITQQIDSPYIVKLHFSFQSETKLFLILDFMDAGDLCYHIVHKRKIKEALAVNISSQVLLGLKCLHENDILYRDLKPMNILIDQQFGVKLTDFGLSKITPKSPNKDLTNSICGTVQYLAPEVALGKDYNHCIDWWSFGVILYEMISGKLPFDSKERTVVVKNIISKNIKFRKCFSPAAKDLITKLLERDPEKRLGAKGAEEVMNHEFFKNINWESLSNPSKANPEKCKTPRGYSKYCYGHSAESSVISEKGLNRFDIPNFTFVEGTSEEKSDSITSFHEI